MLEHLGLSAYSQHRYISVRESDEILKHEFDKGWNFDFNDGELLYPDVPNGIEEDLFFIGEKVDLKTGKHVFGFFVNILNVHYAAMNDF